MPKTQHELDEIVLSSFARENPAKIMDEVRQMLTVLNLMDVKSLIEIGNENGGSISLWLKLWDQVKIFGVDADLYGLKTSRVDREFRWQSWCTPHSDQRVNITWGDSHSPQTKDGLIKKLAGYGLSKVDLMLIDGDHSEAGTEQDYLDYKELVRPGGVIIIEDIHPYKLDDGTYRPDVMGWKFWDRFKPKPIHQDISRAPHPRANWHVWDYYHNPGNQKSFGWGWIFV